MARKGRKSVSPPEQIFRATAARKRGAAAKLEGKAKLLREQADELDQRDAQWRAESVFLRDSQAS
jgi:hypothetical protein